MFLILWVTYSLVHLVSFAGATSASSQHQSSSLQLQLRSLDNTTTCGSAPTPEFDQRSIGDIIWGCLATVFACSWVAVHPNIPPPDSTWRTRALIRCELMVWTIIAPEVIIFLAAKQYIAARQLRSIYRGHGWTLTHGFFIQMGGFVLYDGKTRKGVISPQYFSELLYHKLVAIPDITVDEIEDRSKGDGLSKGLVLLQTTWFIIQLGTRLVKGLSIAQLELATSGFAALNGFMYFFWWYKPLDVKVPVTVHLLHPTMAMRTLNPDLKVDEKTKRNWWQNLRRSLARVYWDRFRIVERHPDYKLLNQPSVPLFFSSAVPRPSVVQGNTIASVLGSIFGAIHCAGWTLSYPSHTEALLWRISASIIVLYPTIFLLAAVPQLLFPRPNDGFTPVPLAVRRLEKFGLFMVCLPIYVLARLFVLVEAFISLRALPPSATYDIVWTTFLPHI